MCYILSYINTYILLLLLFYPVSWLATLSGVFAFLPASAWDKGQEWWCLKCLEALFVDLQAVPETVRWWSRTGRTTQIDRTGALQSARIQDLFSLERIPSTLANIKRNVKISEIVLSKAGEE